MITLYGFGPGFGLPEISPYVTKTEVQLKMMGLDYVKQQAMPDNSPKGQLPFIDDGEVVADSTFIRRHLERKHDFDLDAGLDERQRAEAWAIERMIENHFNWAFTYTRWMMPENFAKGPAHFFDGAPETVRDAVREDDVRSAARGDDHSVSTPRVEVREPGVQERDGGHRDPPEAAAARCM